ncbi:hypothetical protein L596_005340 [Steinernema carpocapsae]|uniref:B30.2/SPRY domain-containing protein n=1 Tax=Steinernema carpocapsae TaxID=34508 RepID=A0A4U8UYP4_STECR|nr:hypothetical protein L596_005340 [Steinernema carpocapsae]
MSTYSPTGIVAESNDAVVFVDGIPMMPDESKWRWDESSKERSPIVYEQILFKDSTVVFHPELAFGTAGARIAKPLTKKTVAYWEITVPHALFGTSLMFGIGTRRARTNLQMSFSDLLGEDEFSAGLSHQGAFCFDGHSDSFCPPLGAGKMQGTTVGILFNGPQASLTYFCDGVRLGTASPKIDLSEVFFPMVSSTAQQSRFQILRHLVAVPLCKSLFESSLERVASMVASDHDVRTLPIPECLKTALIDQLKIYWIHNGYDFDCGY